ncbi:protein NEN1-like isoform X2 [Cynara cardunculus var. scolymus]|uniref:protein NEN1-like isoform X2 n=1 Tax=Cynara cardunculus var. scolymus TaxID=59895 RepID=UPI000D62AF05|nr:protein NEN1-like isoform X2 [Cynara cardunculus var. scolymus]
MVSSVDRSEIAFFDLETTVPTRPGQGFAILEFGSILVCPRKLVELESYETLVRPHNLSLISTLSVRANGITADAVVSAPTFSEIADRVYDILHGRIWAGHNIIRFDCVRLREAFAQINRPPPEPKGTIDSLALLTQRFGRRAGDMKMASLAAYFGLGKQTHRSLDDVRMNLEVLKYCATVLFLMHSNSLRVRFGFSTKYVDLAGRPRLSIVVDAPPNLCGILDACDELAKKRFVESDSDSEWRPVVNRRPGFYNFPTVRLQLPNVVEGDSARLVTEIYQKESPSSRPVVLSMYDVEELQALIHPGSIVDAYFSLDPYDYQQNAGIRLVAKKLIVESN